MQECLAQEKLQHTILWKTIHEFAPLSSRSFNLDDYHQLGMSSACYYDSQVMSYDPIFEPHQAPRVEYRCPPTRSFHELHIERSYLLNALQREDHKATELLKKVRDIQESLQGIQGQMQRKLKRQLGQTKCAMSQCTKQEKLILSRLGQVTYEIQSKERWIRIEHERLLQLKCDGFQQMRLDASCPEFVPQIYPYQPPLHIDYFSGNQGGYYHPMPTYAPAPGWLAPEIHLEPCDPTELPCVVSSPISTQIRSNSMVNLAPLVEIKKRLSYA